MHYKVVHVSPRVIWTLSISLTLYLASPAQLTLKQTQKPFLFLLFIQMKFVPAFDLCFFIFLFSIFTWLSPHHVGLSSNSISSTRPSPILSYTHPTHSDPLHSFHSTYHHQKLPFKFFCLFVSLIPIHKV